MDKKQQGWRSISSTVKRDFYDTVEKVAAQEGVKVGSLVRRALVAYCSTELQNACLEMNVDGVSLIRQSIPLFQRISNGDNARSLHDRLARLELWIDKLFFILCGKNERLMAQMRVEVENRMRDLSPQSLNEESDRRQRFIKSPPAVARGVGGGFIGEVGR